MSSRTFDKRFNAAPMQSILDRAWQDFIRHPSGMDLPVPERSLELAAKLALDEGVLWAMSKMTPQSSDPKSLQKADRELNASLSFYEDMGWLETPLSFHQPPPSVLYPKFSQAWRGGLRYEHMKFESGYVPHERDPDRDEWLEHRRNKTAHAWVLRHRRGSRPWMICLHGYGMGTPWTDLAAFRAQYLHKELGMNVVNFVSPLHGLRAKRGAHGGEYFDGSPASPVHGSAQAVWDVRRIIGWVREQGATGVGLHGISLGGSTAALLATLEPDLDCVVAGVPATCFDELFRHHTAAAKQPDPDFWQRVARLQSVISPLSGPSLVARERLHIYAGVVDRLVPPSLPHALWRHWGKPWIHWYQGSHLSFMTDTSVREFLDDAFVRTRLVPQHH